MKTGIYESLFTVHRETAVEEQSNCNKFN